MSHCSQLSVSESQKKTKKEDFLDYRNDTLKETQPGIGSCVWRKWCPHVLSLHNSWTSNWTGDATSSGTFSLCDTLWIQWNWWNSTCAPIHFPGSRSFCYRRTSSIWAGSPTCLVYHCLSTFHKSRWLKGCCNVPSKLQHCSQHPRYIHRYKGGDWGGKE